MPLFVYKCNTCGQVDEVILSGAVETLSCSRCRGIAIKQVTSPAVIKVQGSWNSPRGRWCRDWTPNSPQFSTGSCHGERY